jgi:hypothetical protein
MSELGEALLRVALIVVAIRNRRCHQSTRHDGRRCWLRPYSEFKAEETAQLGGVRLLSVLFEKHRGKPARNLVGARKVPHVH